MKKLLFSLSIVLATMASAQNNGGYDGGNDGYYNTSNNEYGYYNDDSYFPDDYYYDYPEDYYNDSYYQSYYNDYRKSIVVVNWNDFFRRNRLSNWQIQQVVQLNALYSSYNTWNSFYRHNPDRWYYDRYYALNRILGPEVFVVFQTNYYQGYDPIVYFQNYRRNYYVAKFQCAPRYRRVNIAQYRVDRNKYYQNNNGNEYGWSKQINRNNPGGFKEDNKNNNGGYRSDNSSQPKNNGGFQTNTNNGGFRSQTNTTETRKEANNGGFRGNTSVKPEQSTRNNSNNGGFRSSDQNTNRTPAPKVERSENNNQRSNESGRSGGFRQRLTRN